jgi:hypothetical protein
MSNHLNAQISAFGKRIFATWLQSNNTVFRQKDNVFITKDGIYKVLTKKFALYNPEKIRHNVTGINEDKLEIFRVTCRKFAMNGSLVFVDYKLGNIKCISLEQWDKGIYVEDIIYPVNHNSPTGGRILYMHINAIPTIAKLTDVQVAELTRLATLNKSDKHQLDLFLKK